jgi:hypothetical protein
MRSSILGLTLGLLAPAMIGCGDSAKNTADAAPTFKGYDADEGGEIRAEYVRFSDTVAGTRVVAYLYKTAGSKKFFPFINLNGCTNMTPTPVNWPMATNPLSERVAMDPGTITISGGPMSLALPRQTAAGTDFLGRAHGANDWFFYFNMTDGPKYIAPKTKQTVAFGGSADMPAQTFTDVLYTPADFMVTTPGLAPVTLTAGTAMTFNWTTPDSAPPPGYVVGSVVAFAGPGPSDGPAIVCAEPNDGSITVPAAMIDVVRAKYPSGGLMARQTLTHVTREMVDKTGPTGRRIDFISTWCTATPYAVQ